MKPLRILMIGFGNVGKRLIHLLSDELPDHSGLADLHCQFTGIFTKHHGYIQNSNSIDLFGVEKHFGKLSSNIPDEEILQAISNSEYDVLVELSTLSIEQKGDPAISFVNAALQRGKHVVTANKGPAAFAYHEINELANIVNNISNFEVQLNLARDLKRKGMDELAAATFNLGVTSARKHIAENGDNYQKLRTYWLMEKYAFAVEQFDLVEECGNRIMTMLDTANGDPLPPDKEKKVDYFQNQTYLWMAKVQREKANYPESEKYLKKFIQTYPHHEEINYARYELGRVYEDANQKDDAAQTYKTVGESMWKKKAQKRLSILGY